MNNSKNIKLGLIGVGNWGLNYLRTVSKIDGVDFVCVTSIKSEFENLIDKNCKVISDWKKLLTLGGLDGVIISTPPHSHYEIIIECLNLGIPLLVEKPLVTDIKQAEMIYGLAREKDVLVLVDYIHLHNHDFLEICKSKRKSEVKNIISLAGNNGPFRKDIRALWDWTPHDLAMCIKFMNQVPFVSNAYYLKRDFGYSIPSELIFIELTFSGGIKANLTVGNLMKVKTRKFIVNFENDSIVYDPFEKKSSKKNVFNQNKLLQMDKKPLTNLVEKFAREIKSNSCDFSDLKLSIEITSILSKVENLLLYEKI